MLTLDQQVAWLFRINAAINVTLAVRGIVDPEGMTAAFGGPAPNYPFLIQLWSGLADVRLHVLGDEPGCAREVGAHQVQLDREVDHCHRGHPRVPRWPLLPG